MHKVLVGIAMGSTALTMVGCMGMDDDAKTNNARMRNSKVYIGALTCDISASTGYLITSSKKLECIFEPMSGGSQAYEGEIRRLGLDLGYTKPQKMLWKVFSIGSDHGIGAVQGNFIGENAGVTAGQQVAGNWLYGGKDGAAVLQGTNFFAGTDYGYDIQYGVAQITLKMKAGPTTVEPATTPVSAERVPDAAPPKPVPKN